MPLVLTTLEASIKAACEAAALEPDVDKARDKFVKELAKGIDAYIKTGTVTGTSVSGGAVTGTIT